MSHLTLEALARLVDEAPGTEELTHLAECAACRTELDALRDQREALAGLPKMMPPPDAWPRIRVRLREEGLIEPGRRLLRPSLIRAAAAAALFVGGGATGYAMRGVAVAPAPAGADITAAATPADASTPERPALGLGATAAEDGTTPTAPDDLTREVDEAEATYFAALDRYMQATNTQPADPATRLATLDNMVLTAAEALNEAPADPLINSYYLTFLAQRNAYLRQLATSAEPVF